ncbi:MAG: DUF924 family protein [Micropepsaceae bacterium]
MWPGPFGATISTSRILARLDQVEMDVEAVREHQRRALLHVGFQVILVDVALQLVRRHHHDDVRPLRRIGDAHHLHAFGFGLGRGGRTGTQRHGQILHAAVAHVQHMGMALAAIADDRDLLALDEIHVRIAVVVNTHDTLPSLVVPVTRSDVMTTAAEILEFWTAAGPAKWYAKDDAFDAAIAARFKAAYEAAAAGAYDGWAATPEGALALIITLDQFPRNMFRDDVRAFAADAKARDIANAAIEQGLDKQIAAPLNQFFFLPLMHSEDLADQDRCVAAFAGGTPENRKYAEIHRDIIARFGRFPHRNAVLGRTTTPAEQAFLDKGGFAG